MCLPEGKRSGYQPNGLEQDQSGEPSGSAQRGCRNGRTVGSSSCRHIDQHYAVNGNATIYVVGTDGELHGFSTPKQYKAAGYDGALNTTVNTTGGMTIGSTIGVLGANGNALATSSDGAIVDSSGTYYTFGGGRALGIPTPARLTL